jgi:hypothetical protein
MTMPDTTTTTAASDAPSVATATITTSTTVKPGWQTSEFWLGLGAKLLGAAYAAGLIGDGTIYARIAGLAVVVLAYFGYAVSRGIVKAAALVLLLAVLAPAQLACSWQQVKADAKAGETAVIDCAKADAAPLEALLVQFAVDAVGSVGSTGAVAWGALETEAIGQGEVIGGCALKRFVAALESAPPPASTARSLLAPPDNAAGGRAALARVSAHFGGVTWTVR